MGMSQFDLNFEWFANLAVARQRGNSSTSIELYNPRGQRGEMLFTDMPKMKRKR